MTTNRDSLKMDRLALALPAVPPMAVKHCPKCVVTKPVDMFCKHRNRRDGLQAWCTECLRAHYYANRDKKIKAVSKYQSSRPHKAKEWKAKAFETIKDTPEFRFKQRARLAVRNAIKRGDLVRPSKCSNCAKECKPHAHHADYAKPLDVTWLCAPCHGKHHRTAGIQAVHA